MRETLKSWLKGHNAKADWSMPKRKASADFWVIYQEYIGDRSGRLPVLACRSYEQACRIAESRNLPFVRQITR